MDTQANLSTTKGLRLVLIAGFGGMLLIFLIAAADAVALLRQMRAENEILREASLERSRRLASIRTYVRLCHSYIRDYPLDLAALRSQEHMRKMHDVWSRALNDLDGYPSSTLEEKLLLKNIENSLTDHWKNIEHALAAGSHLEDEGFLLRTAVVEISTRVDDADARQLASMQSAIQQRFEMLGRRLTFVLMLAMGAALLLATGCLIYILRIERQNRRRYDEIVKARHALGQLSARLVTAQEMERRTISRELHDEVGQTLGAVLVDAANLATRIPSEDAVSHRYLDSIRALADSSINSIRNIALLLRPSMLDDLGLIPALEWQAREVSRRGSPKVKVLAGNVQESLPEAIRTCVYRIVQEALHNVASHSGAKNAVVSVGQKDGEIELTVQDDGSGFDPAKTRGLGLLGMEERVKQLGGRIEIQSQPGKGTTVRVTLPVSEPTQ